MLRNVILVLLLSFMISCQTITAQRLFSYEDIRPSYNLRLAIKEDSLNRLPASFRPFSNDIRDSIRAYVDSSAKIYRGRPVYVRGYTVMVYNGLDLNKAKRLRSKMLTTFPDQPAFLDYEPPNAQLKVGQFRQKIYAQQMKIALSGEGFNGLIVVPEKIKIRDKIDTEDGAGEE